MKLETNTSQAQTPIIPLDGPAVQKLEDALSKSPSKSILLQINDTFYRLSREGRWFKFSSLTKKNAVKRSAVFQTLSELYNQAIHGNVWTLAPV